MDGSAEAWFVPFPFFGNLPGKIFERGYDVWVPSGRGALNSNVNIRDGEWSLKERWDYSYTDMGIYDIPAQIETILDVTGKPKVTLIGFSLGGI